MSVRVLMPVGLALVCVLHASVTGQLAVPVLALIIALAGAAVGPRLTLVQASQALVFVATAGVVFLAAALDPPRTPALGGPKLQYVVLSGTALLTVAARLWMHNPERGHGATWIIGLLAIYCSGRVQSPLFLPLTVAFLLVAWLQRAWRPRLGLRHLAVGLAVLMGAASVGTGTTAGLQRLGESVNTWIISGGTGAEVGFGAGAFQLGSMDGMLQSDEVILRVHGDAAVHFRGQAYTAYQRGVWLPPAPSVEPSPRGEAPDETATVIEFVSDDEERLFLPSGSASVEVSPPAVAVDALGVPRPKEGAPIEVRFDTDGAVRFPPAPPTDKDLRLPGVLSDALGPLVQAWVGDADSDAERIARIVKRLEQDYTYSLHYERDPERDPVLQFMLESKLGHCEYFASGLVMAARTAGVPARLVSGFRSIEVSPFGGHRIVRSRDAHAWGELWIDGAWVLVDPSPRASFEPSSPRNLWAGARDDLSVLWDRYGLQAVVALLILVFVGLQVRTLLRGREAAVKPVDEAWIEGPPAYLLEMLEVLGRMELRRDPAETVEAFAERVGESGQAEAGVLLRRYAALRYGGVGDSGELAGGVDAWLSGVAHSAPG